MSRIVGTAILVSFSTSSLWESETGRTINVWVCFCVCVIRGISFARPDDAGLTTGEVKLLKKGKARAKPVDDGAGGGVPPFGETGRLIMFINCLAIAFWLTLIFEI